MAAMMVDNLAKKVDHMSTESGLLSAFIQLAT